MSSSSSELDTTGASDVKLHAGDLYYKGSGRYDWEYAWGILKAKKTVCLFTSDEEIVDNLIAKIPLDKDTSFICSEKTPLQFKLHFAKRKDKKRFKVKTAYERHLWKAYIVGIATGSIPQDVILSPHDKQTVEDKVRRVNQDPHPHRRPSKILSTDTSSESSAELLSPRSVHHSERHRHHSPSMPSPSWPESERRPDSSAGVRDSMLSIDSGLPEDCQDGGPIMRHKFTMDGDDTVPPWFFEHCDQQNANQILISNQLFGNTLMRVSTSARNTGSYAISSCLSLPNGRTELVHYEVIRVAEGFRIDVQNCTTAFRTLTEVMAAFVSLAGQQNTRLMTTNRKDQLLGTDQSSHAIYSRRIPVPPQNPAAPSTSDSDDDDTYEKPVLPLGSSLVPVAVPPPPIMAPIQPVQPGSKTLNRILPNAPSFKVQHPSGRKTVGSSDWKQPGKTSMQDIEQVMSETDIMRRLDWMLKGQEAGATASQPPPPPLLPPLPPVPDNRPMLPVPDTTKAPRQQTTSDGADLAARWKKRSHSVPNFEATGTTLNADYLLPIRRTSLSFARLFRLRERWSHVRRGGKVPLPLPPDYSSEDDDTGSGSSGDGPTEASSLDGWTLLDVTGEEAAAAVGSPHVPASANGDSSAKKGAEPETDVGVAVPAAEEYSVCYSDIVVQPRAAALRPTRPEGGAVLRPDSTVYTEVVVGPDWQRQAPTMTVVRPEKALLKETTGPPPPIVVAARPRVTQSGVKAQSGAEGQIVGSLASGSDPSTAAAAVSGSPKAESVERGRSLCGDNASSKGEESAYYLDLLGEDEVIYDLMGKGEEPVERGRSLCGDNASSKGEESAYYLDLLGEDEVIYDLMYSSGKGFIQFWPTEKNHAPLHSAPAEGCHGNSEECDGDDAEEHGALTELQKKLQKRRLMSEDSDAPSESVESGKNEEYNLYENVP